MIHKNFESKLGQGKKVGNNALSNNQNKADKNPNDQSYQQYASQKKYLSQSQKCQKIQKDFDTLYSTMDEVITSHLFIVQKKVKKEDSLQAIKFDAFKQQLLEFSKIELTQEKKFNKKQYENILKQNNIQQHLLTLSKMSSETKNQDRIESQLKKSSHSNKQQKLIERREIDEISEIQQNNTIMSSHSSMSNKDNQFSPLNAIDNANNNLSDLLKQVLISQLKNKFSGLPSLQGSKQESEIDLQSIGSPNQQVNSDCGSESEKRDILLTEVVNSLSSIIDNILTLPQVDKGQPDIMNNSISQQAISQIGQKSFPIIPYKFPQTQFAQLNQNSMNPYNLEKDENLLQMAQCQKQNGETSSENDLQLSNKSANIFGQQSLKLKLQEDLNSVQGINQFFQLNNNN